MLAVEYFEVECEEKKGAEYYKQIANDVLLDHNLLRVIDKLFRIASQKEAFGENPWQDIAGYGLLKCNDPE